MGDDLVAMDVANNVAQASTWKDVAEVLGRTLRYRLKNREALASDTTEQAKWFRRFPALSEQDIADIVIAVTIDDEVRAHRAAAVEERRNFERKRGSDE